MTVERAPGSRRIGGDDEVAWINDATEIGLAITAAIPAVFERYATIVVPTGVDRERSDGDLIGALRACTPDQPWWLGYLDTGTADVVLPDAPRTTLYAGWGYVLLQADPEEALTLRSHTAGPLPDLMFPVDRSWLVSKLWDDDWRCVGGPASLISALQASATLDTRRVEFGQDSTPPGHTAI